MACNIRDRDWPFTFAIAHDVVLVVEAVVKVVPALLATVFAVSMRIRGRSRRMLWGLRVPIVFSRLGLHRGREVPEAVAPAAAGLLPILTR
jgi:hypothetical protein